MTEKGRVAAGSQGCWELADKVVKAIVEAFRVLREVKQAREDRGNVTDPVSVQKGSPFVEIPGSGKRRTSPHLHVAFFREAQWGRVGATAVGAPETHGLSVRGLAARTRRALDLCGPPPDASIMSASHEEKTEDASKVRDRLRTLARCSLKPSGSTESRTV